MTSPQSTEAPSLLSGTATASGASGGGVSTIRTSDERLADPLIESVPSPDPPVPTESQPGSSAAGGGTKVRPGHGKNGNFRSGKGRPRTVTSRETDEMAVMKAAGFSDERIARVLERSFNTVKGVLKRPDVQEHIRGLREILRTGSLSMVLRTQEALTERLADSLVRDDAKATDSYARAARSLEAVAASASGENKPASVNVAVGVQTAMSPDERDELLREFRRTITAEGSHVG